MTDTEWQQLMAQSPEKGRRALIDQYSGLVYAIVYSKLQGLGSREDVEDCVSDVFVKLFRSADGFHEEGGSLKAYISVIARHTAVDAFRRLSYQQSRTVSIEEETMLPASDDPVETVEKRMRAAQLWQCIRSLGEPDTSILIRQYFYEQTAKEIARALSMSAEAVQKRSLRARGRLRTMLEKGEWQ